MSTRRIAFYSIHPAAARKGRPVGFGQQRGRVRLRGPTHVGRWRLRGPVRAIGGRGRQVAIACRTPLRRIASNRRQRPSPTAVLPEHQKPQRRRLQPRVTSKQTIQKRFCIASQYHHIKIFLYTVHECRVFYFYRYINNITVKFYERI